MRLVASHEVIRCNDLILDENPSEYFAFVFRCGAPNEIKLVTTVGADGLGSISRPRGVDAVWRPFSCNGILNILL
jgi:hypothetical protein